MSFSETSCKKLLYRKERSFFFQMRKIYNCKRAKITSLACNIFLFIRHASSVVDLTTRKGV